MDLNTETLKVVGKLNLLQETIRNCNCNQSLNNLEILENKGKTLKRLDDIKTMLLENENLFLEMQEVIKKYNDCKKTMSTLFDGSNSEVKNGAADNGGGSNDVTDKSSYDFSPMVNTSEKKYLQVHPKFLALDIAYVEEDEFNKIPQYMRLRYTKENINTFVNTLNKTIINKYNLLSKGRQNLKVKERDLYSLFRRQQNSFKGKTFISQVDLARELGNNTLDKRTHNLLVILRHLKRFMETRVNNEIFYFLS